MDSIRERWTDNITGIEGEVGWRRASDIGTKLAQLDGSDTPEELEVKETAKRILEQING